MVSATDIKLFDLIFHNLYIKSHVYNDLKKWNKSIDQLEFALEILNGNEGTNEKDLIDLYKSSSIAFEESGQFTQSLKWLKKHFEIDKTIQDEKQKKEIKSIKFKKEITNLQYIPRSLRDEVWRYSFSPVSIKLPLSYSYSLVPV